jgi:hypothetical protein
VVQHGLRNQHTVERVFQRTGECSGRLPVNERDRQWDEALCVERGTKIVSNRRDARKLADAELGGNLSGRRSADENGVALVTNRNAGRT